LEVFTSKAPLKRTLKKQWLFGSFHFKSSLEKDSKKAMVTVTEAPICKIRPLYGYCMNKLLIFEVLITTL
jgi:hypothetical protein